MFAVIFEAEPFPDSRQRYLELAAELKPLLADIEGFISIERFQSLSQPEKILSLSWWQDEEAVLNWRRQTEHRSAQQEGRDSIFSHYRLRVTSVVRDYSKTDRGQAPVKDDNCHG
ncbi:antibiotic biosynthesis monooxygenase [Buttiauxella sp. B2]|uniref:antibiotic biosynthesis monooxygenase family protein n=1 Tax=Buttiauxella sp. B2 TaxID=2587812 RepID=UPI001120CBB6|nr:antibiotic biosynthesis monooxygenase [Buttiauxella sp. B2]TNV19729.1 antibiotic biosynthesis monooxygenase [Buttiauxella sp. B2]